jgi:hypothetical protein
MAQQMFCVTRTSSGRFLGVLRLPRNDSALGVDEPHILFRHPEPAETAKDLSRGDEVTRIIQRSVVNPDATILATRLVMFV